MIPGVTTVQLERPSDAVAVVRLARPEVRNAIDRPTLRLLLDAFGELNADPRLAAVVLSTTDTIALSAGADVTEVLSEADGRARMDEFSEIYALIEACPAVTICVMVGNTVGAGAEFASACDLRIAGDNLKLRWVGALLGVPVGPARLAPLIGLAAARRLILESPVLSAEDAVRLNLAGEVVPAAEADAKAVELAHSLAKRPLENLRTVKQMFRDFEQTERRLLAETELLMVFQTEGQGLPAGGARGK